MYLMIASADSVINPGTIMIKFRNKPVWSAAKFRAQRAFNKRRGTKWGRVKFFSLCELNNSSILNRLIDFDEAWITIYRLSKIG